MSGHADVVRSFLGWMPAVGARLDAHPTARIFGRATVGSACVLHAYATIRADYETVAIGDGCFFGEHTTVHIVHREVPARIGSSVTVGRGGVVHAADVGDGVLVAEGAVVIDGARVGSGTVIAPRAVVPPGKAMPSGTLCEGVPARPVRPIGTQELARLHREVREARSADAGNEPRTPASARVLAPPGRALVCDTVAVEGTLRLAGGANVWYGTRVAALGGEAVVGAGSNVQDNSYLLADDGSIDIGESVTIGHNVTLQPCRILDRALVGIGARVGRRSIIEENACLAAGAETAPGTVVTSGTMWGGRPARLLRPLTDEERRAFAHNAVIYRDEYLPPYLAGKGDPTAPALT